MDVGTLPIRPGLTKQVVRQGSGPRANPGERVAVHYTGSLEDGRVFDSSKTRGAPIVFTLGRSEVTLAACPPRHTRPPARNHAAHARSPASPPQVILGWDLGISTMCVGEAAVLTISPGVERWQGRVCWLEPVACSSL